MFRTLIVGYGRAGREIHLPSTLKARQADPGGVFADVRPCAIDPIASDLAGGLHPDEASLRRALEETSDLEPAATVVHVCTPPEERIVVLETLIRYGFRRFLVEKPLVLTIDELRWLEDIVERELIEVGVTMPWLSSAVTTRLAEHVGDAAAGQLRLIESVQDKARFARALRVVDHPSAFDVELPHAIAVALHVAGEPAEVASVSCEDLCCADGIVPNLGAAEIELKQAGGVTTRLRSRLDAPFRRRFVRLAFEKRVVTGYYAVSGDDPYAQVEVHDLETDVREREVFSDDPFPRLIGDWYRYFAGLRPRPLSDIRLNASVVRVLAAAREQAGIGTRSTTAGVAAVS